MAVHFVIRPRGGWRQVSLTEDAPPIPPGAQVFIHRKRELAAILSRDLRRWHMSVSHRERMPTWGEIGFAKDSLLPDVWMVVPHPPRKYWLNYNERVIHLWEVEDQELIEHWRWEGEHAQEAGYGTPTDDVTHPLTHGPGDKVRDDG